MGESWGALSEPSTNNSSPWNSMSKPEGSFLTQSTASVAGSCGSAAKCSLHVEGVERSDMNSKASAHNFVSSQRVALAATSGTSDLISFLGRDVMGA